ncbi:hypothetical protein MMC13_000491 [Lambiella insularis]|nr:hypothetical protein [Lambiella insularis]
MFLSGQNLLLFSTAILNIYAGVSGQYGPPHGMQRRDAYQAALMRRGLIYDLDERDLDLDERDYDFGLELDLVERDLLDYAEFTERDLELEERELQKRDDVYNAIISCGVKEQACMKEANKKTGAARTSAVADCTAKYRSCLNKIVSDRSRLRLGAKGETCTICQEKVKALEKTFKSACDHYYHPDCMKTLVGGLRYACPTCRSTMRRWELEG